MAEYIDRDKAFDAVDKRIDELKADKEFNIAKEICISGVKKHILNTPIADVVERSKINKAIQDVYRIRTDVLCANSCYEPNEVLDIVDQITKLFEEI